MDSLFTSVLEISWQAGLIALAVMAVRPLLRRAPRRAVCMLWLLVALRLLLPARLTVESPVSLQQPESPPILAYQELRQQEKVYVSAPPERRLEMAGPAAAQGFALLDQLPAMKELYGHRARLRKERGCMDIESGEVKLILDENGHCIDVKKRTSGESEAMIEEFMLLANQCAAHFARVKQIPFVYRVHDVPDPERIQKLSTFISNYGYYMKALGRRNSKVSTEEIHPKEIQKLLQKIEGTPEEPMIARLTLRSMKQAKYSTECTGHFGLACQYYCHFTSPIRRYPDLQIHRIIKENLRGRMNDTRKAHYEKILPEVALHASKRERLAEEAERETDKLKKVEYMSKHIGETFEGVISGVTRYGMYVELANTIEGMIRVTDLTDDYYNYSEETYELIGEVTNKHYKLGQRLKIRVKDTDTFMRTIDFELAEEEDGKGKYQADREQ